MLKYAGDAVAFRKLNAGLLYFTFRSDVFHERSEGTSNDSTSLMDASPAAVSIKNECVLPSLLAPVLQTTEVLESQVVAAQVWFVRVPIWIFKVST
jgi:hypothetical protein